MGASLIDWTARAAVACWIARFAVPRAPGDRRPGRLEIAFSGCGWLMLVVHMLCAFHFEHHWSHAAAIAHTARRTAETVGRNWGGGLYVNYATIVLWGADLVAQIVCRRQVRVPARWWTWLINGWIGFVVFNATVVFGPVGWRIAGPIAVLAIYAIRRAAARH